MKRYTFIIIITTVSLGLLVGGLLAARAAGDCDGTTGNDIINCTVNPSNPEKHIDGDLGDDTITVGSNVTADLIDADGQSGTADAKGQGDGGNDVIVNNGTIYGGISGDWVTGAGGNDTITNNGTVGIIYGEEVAGTVTSSGNDSITNNGIVVNSIIADDNATAGGNDTVVNNGTVGGTIDAGGGDDTVTNSGSVNKDIKAGNGNDIITNGGTVSGSVDAGNGNNNVTNNGTVGANIVSGSGTDSLTNNGTVNGTIDAGDGSDTVIIGDGATVSGVISGGSAIDTGTDILQFKFDDPVAGGAAAIVLAGKSPAGGTATFGGHTYTWSNFEQLQAIFAAAAATGQTVTVNIGQIKDGRLNGYDLGAPIAVYCVPNEYIEVIDIRQDGSSHPLAFKVMFDVVNKAVTKAKATFNSISITSGEGDYLSAIQNGSLVAYGPTFDTSKIYKFTFQPDCTYGNVGSEG